MSTNCEHVYFLTFTETNVDIYGVSEFLNDFEKLCIKHNVIFDHKSVRLITGKENVDGKSQENV